MNTTKYIDRNLLKLEATVPQITELCKEALEYQFASVCVNPSFVPLAKQLLDGSDVKVGEAKIAFARGALSYPQAPL
jgi:deoxyribose-phosphate aldolase